jgi:2-polyprenyl-6-methoxyphenol hydroxylase-like FAD-dependent oxidoreductase
VAIKGHVEIAGAGIAGLVAAAALAQRGWTVRVHERAPDLRNFGAGISCWYNFTKVLKAVGAYHEAASCCRHYSIRETRDEHDRVLYTIRASARPGEDAISVTRRHILHSLANAAKRAGAEIVTSSHIVGADAEGYLLTEDGTRHGADLVIGADGINSSVRDSLGLLRSRVPLRDGSIRLLIPRLPEERTSIHANKSIEYWSGTRRLFRTACNDDELYVAFMLPFDDAEGTAVPVRKDTWIRSFPFLRDLIERVGDEGRWDRFEQVSLHRWSSGRVAVIGDAATAMAPNIGQGGGTAAMNALSLAAILSEARDVAEGLAEWERRERPLSDYTQRVSYWYGRMNDLPTPLRNAFIKYGGRSKWLVGLRQRPAEHIPTGYLPGQAAGTVT